jgi:hypothetical protein
VPGHIRGRCPYGNEAENDDRRYRRDEDLRATHGSRKESPNGDRITTEKRAEGMANLRETSEGGGKGKTPAYTLRPPHHALTVITERADTSLVIQDWVGDKPCFVTMDTGAHVTVLRSAIATGLPERQPIQRYTLQTASGEALPIFKEVLLTLTLGWSPLKIWIFVANITKEFILGLDNLRACDASVGLGRQTLRLAVKVVSLWNPRVGPRPSSLVVAKDQIIPAQCEGVMMVRLESPSEWKMAW